MSKNSVIPHNQPLLDIRDQKSLAQALKTRWIAEGPATRLFESQMVKVLRRKYAKATSSGTAALHLALLALDVGEGDEVILPTYTCSALLDAVFYTGAQPKIADIDEKTLGISPQSVAKLLSRKTRAIVVNHTFGLAADIQAIRKLGIPVIEDCAQALGSVYQNKPLGSLGDLSICSFYATKMMTTGYGGMVLTNHSRYDQKIRDLTLFDQRENYVVRYHYSISDFASALGLSQLTKLKSFVQRRRKIASQYAEVLNATDFFFWTGRDHEKPNFYRFVAGTMKPFTVHVQKLRKKGIQSISPVQPYQLLHRYLGLPRKKFPVAETISRSVFSIPIYPALSDIQVKRICNALQELG